MRRSAIVSLAPALLPPVKLYVSVAALQLWNVSTAVPTIVVLGGGGQNH